MLQQLANYTMIGLVLSVYEWSLTISELHQIYRLVIWIKSGKY